VTINVTVLSCPEDPLTGKIETAGVPSMHSNYSMCTGNQLFNAGGSDGTALNGMFFAVSSVRFKDVTDGTSHTIYGQ